MNNKKLLKRIRIAGYLTLVLFLGFGCEREERHYFWYPVRLQQAKCGSYEGEVYLMTNSLGWRSEPYYLDKELKREIQLGSDCVLISIREFPEYEYQYNTDMENKLTAEQKEFLVEGF